MKDFVLGVWSILRDAFETAIKNSDQVLTFFRGIFRPENRSVMHLVALIVLAFSIYAALPMPAIFPIEKSIASKFAHLAVGGVCGYLFWYAVKQKEREHHLNGIDLALGCMWGASGIFVIRLVLNLLGVRDVPLIGSLLWSAFPDWDILILGIGAHRNFFFHSEIVPVAMIIIALQRRIIWLRDFGIGLTIGVASHLLWDMVSVANWPYRYIRHLDVAAGVFWILINMLVGVFFAYYATGKKALSIDVH